MVAFAICAAIWGSTFLAIRVGNDVLPAMWALTLRMVIGTAILGGIMLVTKVPIPKGDALKYALIYGVLEFGMSMPLLYWSEKTLPSGVAALVYATCPITSMYLGAWVGTDHITPGKIIAGVAAMVGLGIVFGPQASGGSLWPIVAGLTAACCGVTGSVLLQKGPRQSAIGSNMVGNACGVVVGLVLSLLMGETHALPSTFQQVWPVLYLGVMGSVVAFSLFAWLLGHWRASTVSYLGVICPVIAVLLGAVMLHEPLTAMTFVGGAIVLVAVGLALRQQAQETQKVA